MYFSFYVSSFFFSLFACYAVDDATTTGGGGFESEEFLPAVNDPDLLNWMQVAALPVFTKLYSVIEKPLKQGDLLRIEVENRYQTALFGGTKSLFITTSSYVGSTPGPAVLGFLSLFLAALFFFSALFLWLKVQTNRNALRQLLNEYDQNQEHDDEDDDDED